MNSRFLSAFICLLSLFPLNAPFSQTTSDAVETQRAFLRIKSLKNLQFEAAAQGARPEVVAPRKSMHAANAVFRVRGLPFHQVQVLLPRGRVYMRTRAEGVHRRIGVRNFQSIPAANAPFRLGLFGFKRVFVGATREKLHPKQAPGNYQGTFNVSVVYH